MTGRESPLNPVHAADIVYELVVSDSGGCTLTNGGEVMWISEADDDFAEAFEEELIDVTDREQTGRVIDWLIDNEYLPPEVDVDVVSEEDALHSDDVS